MDLLEVAITSDTTGQLWNSSVWDVHTGTSLMSYRGGGVAGPRTLSLLGQDYIATSERTKPMMHIWPLNSQEQVQGIRFVLPGRASALAFSPDSCYCVAGIEEKIYIWQIASGSLLAIVNRHYQTVTSVKFCDDGSHFVSAGEDGLVLVWNLLELVTNSSSDFTSQSVAGQHDPLYIFSDHSLPVSDIYIGKGGLRSRLLTVSLDRTCKIYDLSSGELLINVVFDNCLTAVAMDLIELNVFVGTSEGAIHQFTLSDPPRMRDYFLTDADKQLKFPGHNKGVTCLSVSLDGNTLISGGNDEQLLVWHIPSKQKIQGIPHKGPVTNAFFTIVPRNMFANDFSPSIVLHSFQRSVDTSNQCDLEILTKHGPSNFWDDSEESLDSLMSPSITVKSNDEEVAGSKMTNEINVLKKINSDLYQFAIKNLLK